MNILDRSARNASRALRRKPWLTVVAVLIATVVAVAATRIADLEAADHRSGFITSRGTQLFLDGEPYRFTGYNSYVMLGCGYPNEQVEGQARDRFFAGLRPNSVVRVFLQPGTDLRRFDAVLASAREHGQRILPSLTDGNGNCGGIAKDAAWYAGEFRGRYFDWIRKVVPRYRDDPTIAMWELINEPHGAPTETIRNFFDAAGSLVHRLDPNHLVSSGTLLPDTYGGLHGYIRVSASPGIDVLSLHEYDEIPDASHHLEPALAAAKRVDKPLIVGEWGIHAGPPSSVDDDGHACNTYAERVKIADAKLSAYLDFPAVAGALYWSYKADHISTCALSTTRGDPLLDLIHDIPIPSAGADS